MKLSETAIHNVIIKKKNSGSKLKESGEKKMLEKRENEYFFDYLQVKFFRVVKFKNI